jgi:hypothetical protein
MSGFSRHDRQLAGKPHKPWGTFVVTCSIVQANTNSERRCHLREGQFGSWLKSEICDVPELTDCSR